MKGVLEIEKRINFFDDHIINYELSGLFARKG